ncbi:hypothetical protein VMT65_22725 [Nocardia sp. CDC153]|uniref:hypothetical protein n=1 Tax=Nocardia sp. CDC153 TaxID=3112167 RepID=UPI002DBF5C09|nr:hypothetical protein [Nocardia sp. CDC153]MEC3955866.1 hypothetical protein [Nocardia sp. CDC153]
MASAEKSNVDDTQFPGTTSITTTGDDGINSDVSKLTGDLGLDDPGTEGSR